MFFNVTSTSLVNVTKDDMTSVQYFAYKGLESELNEDYSAPLVWIGVYMAAASLFYILFMVADLLRGIRKEPYRIPCKYSSLNTANMMLITIMVKLTVDLSGSMPGRLDQVAKIGSIAFMSTMMAVFNPSLACMNYKTLVTNIIGLVIFVVTIAVNLLIQIFTGVIKKQGPLHLFTDKETDKFDLLYIYYGFNVVQYALVHIGIMLLFLLISISTAITIPSIKKILELKYQERRTKALFDRNHDTRISTVEKLTQHVSRYWIMAKSGSPQFVMARNLLSYTSLTLCVFGMVMYAIVLISLLKGQPDLRSLLNGEEEPVHGNYESDYQWSIPVILITQFIGNVIGTLFVLIRCIRSMQFIDFSWKSSYMFILKKDKYWSQKLSDWKGSHIRCLSSYPRLRAIVHFVRNQVLNLFIFLQITALVSIYQILGFLCILIISFLSFKSTTPVVSTNDELGKYVLQLDDEVQPSQKVVEDMSNSMNRLIERAKKKQNSDFLELLDKFNGFQGVVRFDDMEKDYGFDSLLHSVKLNSWSVPVITLACIAIAVPGITKKQVKGLIKSIDNALLYIDDVEESFNSSHDEYANIRMTTALLYEIKDEGKWLNKSIKSERHLQKLPADTLTRFAEQAEDILDIEKKNTIGEGELMINFPNKLIAAHSMHRIARSILSSYQNEEIKTNERFFELVTSMIADILVACFSNIPQVIMMKCHANEIEKREKGVEAAAKLLGKSTDIIRKLESCKLPSMDPAKMAFIHEWHLYFKQSSSSNLPPSGNLEVR